MTPYTVPAFCHAARRHRVPVAHLEAGLRSFNPTSRERSIAGATLLGPVPYQEMISLVAGARVVVTDSGGLQEEASSSSPGLNVDRAMEAVVR